MKSNGLPYPLEKLIIDTSKNPGRFEIKIGYIEAVGCPVWLGPSFWQFSAASKEAVLGEYGDKAGEKNGVVAIKPLDHPFSSPESQPKQEHMRKLLYGHE